MLRTFRWAAAASLAALVTLHAPPARANGRFPAADHLVVAPDANLMVLRTTFGILISKNRGADWDWLCEKGVGYGGVEDPAIGVTAGSAILAGTFEGLAISQDQGCGWAFVPGGLQDQVVIDLVVRPDSPHGSLVLTNKYLASTDAGKALFSSTVYASNDDAKTWAPLGTAIDPTLILETLEVAASDPARIYASGVRDSGSEAKGAFLVSNDRGATWAEHPVLLDVVQERAPFIAAVDPKNADRVYVRTQGPRDSPSRLLVTDDGGKNFRVVFAGKGEMLGFALSPDGTKVYIGGPLDGLQIASATSLTFAKQSDVRVQCLAAAGTTLYACSAESSGFILGASEDDGKTFASKLHLSTIRGPLACAASSSEARCVPDWPALRDSLGVTTPVADAGDAGRDAGAPADMIAGGGCSGSGEPRAVGAFFAGMFAIVLASALAVRRKRAPR